MKQVWLMAGAVTLAAAMGATARGQDALDEALGAKDAKPAEATKPEAEQKPARPNLPNIVSPDAAKQLDDQDLLNKLTGGKDTGSGQGYDPKTKMDEIVNRMEQIQTRLSKEKDPGVLTQETENRVMIDIDAMIEILKKSKQQSSGKPDPNSKPGEQKQETESEKTQGQQQQQGNQAAQNSQPPSGGTSTPGSNLQDIHEGRLGWGDLPAKDRDLVANGAKEKFLPEYKEMIERYYEALAELGKSAKER